MAYRELMLFHTVLTDEVGQALCAYLNAPGKEGYVALARALWARERSLQAHLLDRILHDENAFTRAAEAGRVTPELMAVARTDLARLGSLFAGAVATPVGLSPLPAFTPPADGFAARLARASGSEWASLAEEMAAYIRSRGAGQAGRYYAFRWEGGGLHGIAEPDPIRLDELLGNDEAKSEIGRNTEQFLQGLPANNLLLYGDRGTGKSSTVKALVHRYGPSGLRVLEVGRADLGELGAVMRQVRGSSLRWVIFIDDLSFEEFEVAFKSFKAMLEGSLERRPSNVLVYATTNRRKLVRERWSDRQEAADEIRPGDSLQEVHSLADRFGMTVVFASPDQEEYLAIVADMAKQRGISMPAEELRREALQWAIWHNGRSGRTARQFVDDLSGRLGVR